jgi:hypothetical protein
MFVDDLLLFGEATDSQIICVKNALECFCTMSGQQVSHEKTSIFFSKNVNSVRIGKYLLRYALLLYFSLFRKYLNN